MAEDGQTTAAEAAVPAADECVGGGGRGGLCVVSS